MSRRGAPGPDRAFSSPNSSPGPGAPNPFEPPEDPRERPRERLMMPVRSRLLKQLEWVRLSELLAAGLEPDEVSASLREDRRQAFLRWALVP